MKERRFESIWDAIEDTSARSGRPRRDVSIREG